MGKSKAAQRLKKLFLSGEGSQALARLRESGAPSAEETLSLLAPKNATLALYHGHPTRRGLDRARDEGDGAKALCEILAALPKTESQSPGLAKRLIQARASSFWGRCLLRQEGVLSWASAADLEQAMRGLLSVAPRALGARSIGPEDLRDTAAGLDRAKAGEPAWEFGGQALEALAPFWLPAAAKSASPRQGASLIQSAIRSGRCGNALAFLKNVEKGLDEQLLSFVLTSWGHHPPRARQGASQEELNRAADWESLGAALGALAPKSVGEEAFKVALTEMATRGVIGSSRQERDDRMDRALRVGARAGWDLPGAEEWPEGLPAARARLRSTETPERLWERAKARYDQFSLEALEMRVDQSPGKAKKFI